MGVKLFKTKSSIHSVRQRTRSHPQVIVDMATVCKDVRHLCAQKMADSVRN